MAIIAQFQGKAVEVIDVYSSGDGRKMAAIRALEGQSYWAWTHGGWAEYDTCTVPAGTLHPMEDCGCVLPDQSCDACKLAARIAYAEGEQNV